MSTRLSIFIGVLLLLTSNDRYLEDFEFIQKTVRQSSAALKRQNLDWDGISARMRPLFAACKGDEEHVRNVLKYIAVLGDSHSGVTRSSVDRDSLPSKWDGLYGGGLWFAWEDGRVMLRGIMAGHPLEKTLPLGSALVEIDGEPAWFALEREKRRITTYQGSSSDHSLFSSMGNRLLPFGDRRQLEIKVMTMEMKVISAKVPRWGPGGKAFHPSAVQLPDGLEWKQGAISGWIDAPFGKKVGYVRITGSMDEATVAAFHEAFDALEGAEAVLLDCRSMGGGSDHSAWEMAGRFFPQAVPNGRGRKLNPSGSWQFAGPVVMLQDEVEVSSAETFTWAMSETKRVVSVGRPTGGWGIIPRVFQCPSGLVDFRLGVNDRPTPIERIHTEGVGWPPDVLLPYGPGFCMRSDPAREVGMEILHLLHGGIPRDAVIRSYGRLFAGDLKGFQSDAKKYTKKVEGWGGASLGRTVAEDLVATLALETGLLKGEGGITPDVLGVTRRLEAIAGTAKKAGLGTVVKRIQKSAKTGKPEAQAQEDLLKALNDDFRLDPEVARKYLARHGKTRVGQFAAGLVGP